MIRPTHSLRLIAGSCGVTAHLLGINKFRRREMNKSIRKILLLCLVLALVVVGLVACNPKAQPPQPDQPDPPQKTYIEIASEADLIDAAAKIAGNEEGYASKTFKVTADIELTKTFAPIDNFKGVFDGQFHTISGLDIASDGAHVGLFSTLNGATVKNLNLVATSVSNSNPDATVGILAGAVENAKVSFVTVSGKIDLGGKRSVAGGIAGKAANSTFINVKSTATVEGDGALAGGVIGALNGKAMVVNAYSAAKVEPTAAVKAEIVGKKVADSAVAFALASSGKIVGQEEKSDIMPSYVYACKVGASASDMGWNPIDWNTSEAVPSLKTELEKEHTNPAVTVDEKAVTAVYGECLPSSLKPETDVDSVAVVGYESSGDAYYDALPVVNGLTLTSVKVDYSALAGEWIALNAQTSDITVAQALTTGGENMTRRYAAVENGLPVLYFENADGLFRLCVKQLTSEQKTALGYASVNGAALLALEKSEGAGYAEAEFFMPLPKAAVGAWDIDGKCVVYSADRVASDKDNGYRSLTVGVALGTYKTCLNITESGLVPIVDGYKLSNEGTPALVKGNESYGISVDYYNAGWIGEDSDLVIVDGKIGEKTLKVVSCENGTGLYDDSTDTFYIATVNGVNSIKGGNVVAFGKDFSGEWIAFKNGAVRTLNIVGRKVRVDNSQTEIEAVIGIELGTSKISFTHGGEDYTLSYGGVTLKDDNGVCDFYAANIVRELYGTYILGTTRFEISGAKVSVIKNGASKSSNLSIVYSDDVISFSSDDMKFVKSGGKMTLTGYKTDFADKNDVLTLFTASELAETYASLSGDWLAPAVGGVGYHYLPMNFTNQTLKLDGNVTDYEFRLVDGTVYLYAACSYENEDRTLILSVSENGFLNTSGLGVGKFMPEGLADSVGNYYEFLVGSSQEGAKGPAVIGFSTEAVLTLNGNTYSEDEYTLTKSGTKFVITVKTNRNTVTFNSNKTLLYNGTTYFNYDRVIPTAYDLATGDRASVDYYQIGALDGAPKFRVAAGKLGSYEVVDDEDGETQWVAPVYPLYGFRYTDADGKEYISESYLWNKTDGQVTITVNAIGASGEKASFEVSYPYGEDFSKLQVAFGDSEPITVYSTKYIDAIVCSYKNNNSTFEVRSDATLWINGENKAYTLKREGKTDTFTVDGVDYVIDGNIPEIADCGGEVLYDARVAHLAGIKLVSFKRGDATADRQHTLILTSDGFFFDNEKVVWKEFPRSNDVLRFTVKDLVEGVETDIEWKLETSGSVNGIATFGMQFFPNYTYSNGTDWLQRWFVPEILLDATLYAVDDTFVTVTQADYSDGFIPFIISINDDQYGYNDYAMSFENDALKVVLEDGNVITFAMADGQITVTLNGVEMESNVQLPPLSDYVLENQIVFGQSLVRHVTVTEEMIIFEPDGGEYMRKEIKNYTFGKWNGYDVIYFSIPNGDKYAILKTEDGKKFVIYVEMLSLLGTYNVDGQAVVASLAFDGEEPRIEISHGNATVTDAKCDSRMYYSLVTNNSRSEMHIGYKADGKQYFITRDHIGGNGNLIASEEYVNLAFSENNNLLGDHKLFATLGKDVNGNAMIKYTVKHNTASVGVHVEVTLLPVDGKANLYTVTYADQKTEGNSYTACIIMAPCYDSSAVMRLLTDEEAAFVGIDKIALNGKRVIFSAGIGATPYGGERASVLISYDGSDPVGATYVAAGGYWTVNTVVDGENVTLYFGLDENEDIKVNVLDANMKVFVTSSYSFYLANSDGKNSSVSYGIDGFSVKFAYKETENVVYDAESMTLSFTQDGQKYYIIIVDATQSYDYNRGAVVTDKQYNFLGTWDLDSGNKLQVSVSTGWLKSSFAAAFDGQQVADVVLQSDSVMTFRLGDFYYGVQLKDGKMYLSENILDTDALEYALMGKYEDRNVEISFAVEIKNINGKDSVVASYTVLRNGEAVVYSIDENTLILTLGEGADAKYYGVCTGSTKGLKEFTASEAAMFGEYTVGDDSVVLIPNCTATLNKGSYKYNVGYNLKLNGTSAADVKMLTDNGDTPKSYVQFKCDSKTYLFYVIMAGQSAVLHELSAQQSGMFGVNTYVDENGNKYLKSNIVFAEDGTFTLGLNFEDSAIAEMTMIDGFGYSFKSTGETTQGKTYYVVTLGSSPYIVLESEYRWYTPSISINGHTVEVTATASSSNKYQVSIDGASAVNGTYKTSGEYGYIQFTSGGKMYILSRNTEDGNAFVLTELTAEQQAMMSSSSYNVKLLNKNNEPYYTSKTALAPSVVLNAVGEVSIGWMYGEYVVTSVDIVTDFDASLYIDTALIVNINGHTSYALMHGSYTAYLTAEEYALLGKWTVGSGDDEKELLVGLYSSSAWMCLQVTYGGSTSDKGHDGYVDCTLHGGATDFVTVTVNDAEYTAIKFTVNGVTYYGYLDNGTMKITTQTA